MNFLIVIATTFFYDYIFGVVLNLFNIKHKKKIYLTVVSVCNLGEAIFFSYLMINGINNNLHNFSFWYYYLSEILGVLIAYLAILSMNLRGVHFKSLRQRRFEREMNDSKISGNLFSIIFILLGLLLFLGFVLAIIKKNDINKAIIYIIGLGALSILFIGSGIYNLLVSKSSGDSKIKGNVLFYIKANGKYQTYKYNPSKDKLEDHLGRIKDIYNLSDYGYIKTPNIKYQVIGISPSDFEKELYDEIKLELFEKDFSLIFDKFEKYSKKLIIINDNNDIIDIKKIS